MTDLAERYGTRDRRRRPVVVAGVVVLVAIALGWLLWAIVLQSTPQVQSQLSTYDVADAHLAKARIVVVRSDPAVQATCVLRAYAEDHSVVGERQLTVGPGRPTTVTLDESLRTERAATAVELLGCTTKDQPQPR